MTYKRKTKDVWCIETNCGYGWETESTYECYDAAKADLNEYRIMARRYFGVCRIVKRREHI